MATLTGVTGSTAEVVTQLKATMQGFLSPSKNMQAALASMGYESGQALLESKGLQGALDALKDSVHGDELAFAGLFSSVEAQTAVLAMAGTQSENLASKTAEMYEAAGAADTAFQRQTNTLKYTVQTVKNLGKNFLTQIGTNILPYVNDLAEAALPKVQNALENAGDYDFRTVCPPWPARRFVPPRTKTVPQMPVRPHVRCPLMRQAPPVSLCFQATTP